MRPIILLMLSVLWVSILPVTAWSQENRNPDSKAFSLFWENDSFTGTDRNYTNGVKLTWSRAYPPSKGEQSSINDWMMKRLPLMDEHEAERATFFTLGQNIYTPDDTERPELILDDRPYAGFSYLGCGFISNTGRRLDVWEIDIGILGPLSQAEAIQNWVHDATDVDQAQGWDNQLDNEVGIELIFESKIRMWSIGHHSGFGSDLIPHLGGRLGNIAIYANLGAEFRFGWFMPQNFGTCPIRPGCSSGGLFNGGLESIGHYPRRYGVHFFTAFETRAVLRDVFLDGNTISDSHSVDKELFVTDLTAGIAMQVGRFRVNYAYTLRTREFKQQENRHAYGAVSIAFTY